MKSQKQTEKREAPQISPTKARPRVKLKNRASEIPLIRQPEVEQQFIGEHPEAFEPFVDQWVVLEGTSIVSHGHDAAIVADEARARGVKVPYIFFRVLPKRNPNVGYL
jgi:hypothetical protein